MAEHWSFLRPEELASRREVTASLAGLAIERSDLLETEFEGARARSVFVQAKRVELRRRG